MLRSRGVDSLEVKSCLALVAGMNVDEIIQFADSNADQAKRRICDSPAFWKALIDQRRDPLILRQRLDINPRDYKLFAKTMIRTIWHEYVCVVNLGTNPESKVSDPIEITDQDEEQSDADYNRRLINDIDDLPIRFKVKGPKPLPGTIGYVIEWLLLVDDHVAKPGSACFLAPSIEELSEAEFEMKYFIGMKVDEILGPKHRIPKYEYLYDGQRILENTYRRGDQIGDFMTKEKLTDLVMRQELDPNPRHLTELLFRISDDEMMVQVWIVQVTF
jgi:hypothetical protein